MRHSLLEASRRLAIAPMLDWTDSHCRYFHRQLSQNTLLYTEMVNVNAIIHGDAQRHLSYHDSEHPIVLQLGGSDAKALAKCAKIAEEWRYDEVNLNCGCPSERVQSGSFGACLMNDIPLVVDCVRAMQDACAIEVSVKHRIGLDKNEEYAQVRDFVGALHEAGVRVFVVHARNAWLKGLSPKENREIPPLRYDVVYQLKRDFPQAHITLNGGVTDYAQIQTHLKHVDGVMVGRWFYHEPYALTQADAQVYQDVRRSIPTRAEVVRQLMTYAQAQIIQGVPLRAMVRHWLSLFHGQPHARAWRAQLSNAQLLAENNVDLLWRSMPAGD